MGVKLGSLTLREEHRLMVFGNRVLKRVFGPKGCSNGRMENVAQWGAS
jgi:hypothetical protein